jgi:hypothetical protein
MSVFSPAKSSKSQPFRIVTTLPRGLIPRLDCIASAAHDRVRLPRDQMRDACAFCFARAAAFQIERCACITTESRSRRPI